MHIGIAVNNGIVDHHHAIISYWQLRQAIEWDFQIRTNIAFYYQNNSFPLSDYLGLNELIPIISRWIIL